MGDVREKKGESKKGKKKCGVEYLKKKKWNSGILNVIFPICYVEWWIFLDWYLL